MLNGTDELDKLARHYRSFYINLAKRMVVDNIYRSAKLEGINCTFASTKAILENKNSQSLKPSDINIILTLRDAWRFILDSIDEPTSLKLLLDIHSIIGKSCDIDFKDIGVLRRDSVRIGGTNWRPEIPDGDDIWKSLSIYSTTDNIDDAINMYNYLTRLQPFMDGNKRVAGLMLNHYLLRNSLGVFMIDDIETFFNLLVKYYETNNDIELHKFLKEKCVYKD